MPFRTNEMTTIVGPNGVAGKPANVHAGIAVTRHVIHKASPFTSIMGKEIINIFVGKHRFEVHKKLLQNRINTMYQMIPKKSKTLILDPEKYDENFCEILCYWLYYGKIYTKSDTHLFTYWPCYQLLYIYADRFRLPHLTDEIKNAYIRACSVEGGMLATPQYWRCCEA